MKYLKKIQNHSQNNPNRVAISLNSKISYSSFWQLAINLAFFLKKKKINRICILQSDNDDFISYIAIVASLISGKTYIPLNKNTPLNRLKLIIKSSKSNILISQKKIKEKVNCKLFFHNDILKLKKIRNFKIINSSKDAYIIYTSGSTGEPKGVRISRKSLDHYIFWISKSFFKDNDIRCSQHPGIGFDLSVADIFGTLCNGGTLFPIQNNYDQLFLSKFIKKNNLTHWVSVPSAVDLICNKNFSYKKDLSSLKKMLFCGEVLKKIHLQKIFSLNKNINVINTYGPTEATVSCTSISLNYKNYKSFCKPSASFGKPIIDMKIGFLGGTKKQGEIFISGPQLSKGYIDNKILNKKKFIKIKNKQSFVTGDMCKFINGNYYFLNRVDRQVKILGFRIELDEIDSLIGNLTKNTSHSIIYKNKIFTFFNGKLNENYLNIKLKKYLPKYMLPYEIIRVKKFPKNLNFKIDENKLIKLI
tara:strand:+ start:234 stop:1655 length:1422 start_codon:yes stop_codon:yes gene_type:complete